MRIRYVLLALGFGLLTILPSPAAHELDAERLAKLIAQLGSPSFEERDQATRELEEIGLPALEALRKAAKNTDLEMQRRAEELVKKMESRLENDSILAPTRVRLVCNDRPVLEALADLAKKAGYPITYVDDPAK